jgi:hypothetical protein
MAACPKGHESETTDYCDVCGAAMTAAPTGQDPAGPPSSGSGAVPSPRAAARTAALPAVCPECGTPMTGRFCEVDGFDALAAPSPSTTAPPPAATTATMTLPSPASADGAVTSGSVTAGSVPSRSLTAGSVTDDVTEATLAVSSVTSPGPSPAGPATNGTATAAGWHVVVSADRAHFDRVESWNGPDPTIAYPRFCPVRRFPLTGEQILIGRRSRSRGSYPDIDLAGRPEDIAVSHLHALLVAQPDGGWAVVDLRSANCTFVNDATDPIQPELPVPLADGDHIHVGSFTRITLHATPL